EMKPNGIASFSVKRPFILPPNPYGLVTTNERRWGPDGPNRQWYTGPALYFAPSPVFDYRYRRINLPTAPDVRLPTVAAWSVGINAYAMGPEVDFFDLLGLADPLTSHLQVAHRGIPGHEKPLPEPWIVARLIAP